MLVNVFRLARWICGDGTRGVSPVATATVEKKEEARESKCKADDVDVIQVEGGGRSWRI
jgi:hypothetical protein